MYSSHFEIVKKQIVEGLNIKVSHQDDTMIMTELTLRKGTLMPEHIHLSDHSAYLLKGKIRLFLDGVPNDFVQGDSWCIGKKIRHCTEVLEDSIILEVYEPETEDSMMSQYANESEMSF